ncbi:uncharacterized protein BDV14DRAFT_179323 [Aspergillus stella-maris]|uniref:uncharacterized protein n=1 Tax=Aspergillus stella-maris TaxID=1810926 RepID=UPI003CCD8905
MEILHLGWTLYQIVSWEVNKSYFFSRKNPDMMWLGRETFSAAERILLEDVAWKCWVDEYSNVEHIKHEAGRVLDHGTVGVRS